ncbi:aldo/keto reductase [Amycolatopsis sp. Hca4]|uniref:aldo/keto reductase n=1 Tax=Amycolatopsis sp. Hca4 TaxID=2742131 RepID=UPI0015916A58|nr:aldo/keto reductase [Amycolatopsis sp. Hca4]QKV75813.1 aldo/keto reductase [Amycolatopsis sp. Hca4]
MTTPSLALNDGRTIPRIGAGTWPVSDRDAPTVVHAALEAGFRHIDTAAAYGNESGVGTGIRTGGVEREDLFLTTKIGNNDHGRRRAARALEESLRRLQTDYVDLALIHWPMPGIGLYEETWQALIDLREAGKARSIGVSNFRPEHLDRIIRSTGVTPAVNQIEVNPIVAHRDLRKATIDRGIVVESWSPLGPSTNLLGEPALATIAAKQDRTPAQIILRWHLDHGLVVIPKSSSPQRLRENIAVTDFTLDEDDHATLDGFDQASPARYSAHLAGG